MPDSLPKYTDRAADMTGLLARRARQAEATGRTWSRAVEVIPRLARCSVIKDRSVPAPEGLSWQARTALRATTQYIGEFVLDPVLEHFPLPRGTRQCSGGVNAGPRDSPRRTIERAPRGSAQSVRTTESPGSTRASGNRTRIALTRQSRLAGPGQLPPPPLPPGHGDRAAPFTTR